MSTTKMILCRKCQEKIEAKSKVCPHCGTRNSSKAMNIVGNIIGGIAIMLGLLATCYDAVESSDSGLFGETEKMAILEKFRDERVFIDDHQLDWNDNAKKLMWNNNYTLTTTYEDIIKVNNRMHQMVYRFSDDSVVLVLLVDEKVVAYVTGTSIPDAQKSLDALIKANS